MGLLPSCGCVSTTVWLHHLDSNETLWEKLDGSYTRIFQTNLGNNTQQNSRCMATCLPSHKPSEQEKQDMLNTAGEVRTNI